VDPSFLAAYPSLASVRELEQALMASLAFVAPVAFPFSSCSARSQSSSADPPRRARSCQYEKATAATASWEGVTFV